MPPSPKTCYTASTETAATACEGDECTTAVQAFDMNCVKSDANEM